MSKKYDVFISYSRKDSEIVNRIVQILSAKGICSWMDKDGIESGDSFKTVIVSAIERSGVFLFFSSISSNSSEWTVKEVNLAIYKKKPIIPIRLDETEYNPSILFDLVGLDYIDILTEQIESSIESKLIKSIKKHLGVDKKHTCQKYPIGSQKTNSYVLYLSIVTNIILLKLYQVLLQWEPLKKCEIQRKWSFLHMK